MNIGLKSENLTYYKTSDNACWITGIQNIDEKTTFTLDLSDNELNNIADITDIYIAKEAFKDCHNLTELRCNSRVKLIDSAAFKNSNLTTVTLSKDTVVNFGAFSDCTALKTITNLALSVNEANAYLGYIFGAHSYLENTSVVPESLQELNTVYNVANYSFHGCAHLVSLTIYKVDDIIPHGLCYGCTRLSWFLNGTVAEVTQPILGYLPLFNCKHIGDEAFYGCLGFNTLYIPKQAFTIGIDSFKNCYKLVRIYNNTANTTQPQEIVYNSSEFGCAGKYALNILNATGAGNTRDDYTWAEVSAKTEWITDIYTVRTFVEEQGSLVEHNYVYLIELPSGEQVDLSQSGITHVHDYVGFCNNEIKKLVLPNSLRHIGKYAFNSCPNLEFVQISTPDIPTITNLAYIGANAFGNCPKLQTLQIRLDQAEEWAHIKFGYPQTLFKTVTNLQLLSVAEDEDTGELAPVISDVRGSLSIHTSKDIAANSFAYASFINKIQFITDTNDTGISIGDFAFYGCTNLSEITYTKEGTEYIGLPDIINCIGENTFDKTAITFISDGGLKTLGAWVFGVTSPDIEECTIKAEYKYFIADIFENCDKLTKIYYQGTIEDWLSISFMSLYSNPLVVKNGSRRNLFVNNGLTNTSTLSLKLDSSIFNTYAFCGLTLAELDLTSISDSYSSLLFTQAQVNTLHCLPSQSHISSQLSGLKILYIEPNRTTDKADTTIPPAACANCAQLEELYIGPGLKSIGESAFYGCHNLQKVAFTHTNLIVQGTWWSSSILDEWFELQFGDYFANPLHAGAELYDRKGKNGYVYNHMEEFTGSFAYPLSELKPYAFVGFNKLIKIEFQLILNKIDPTCFAGCSALRELFYPSYDYMEDPDAFNNDSVNQAGYQIIHGENGSYILNDDTVICGTSGSYSIAEFNSYTEHNITTINSSAFYKATGLTHLTLSPNINSYGTGILEGCTNLKYLTIPHLGDDSRYAYVGYLFGAPTPEDTTQYCPTDLTLAFNGVASIYNHTFIGCNQQLKKLYTTLYKSDSVDSLGTFEYIEEDALDVFEGRDDFFDSVAIGDDTKLTGIAFRSDITSPTEELDLSDLTIIYNYRGNATTLDFTTGADRNCLDYIYKFAFYNNKALETLYLPNMYGVGRGAFKGCSNLVTVSSSTTSPESILPVSYLGMSAFKDCFSKESTNITLDLSAVEVLKSNVFFGANAVTQVILYPLLTKANMSSAALNGMSNLQSITAPTNILRYLPRKTLTDLTINFGTKIEDFACKQCTHLKRVQLAENVEITSIGNQAFSGCICLFDFPWEALKETCTAIGNSAFYNCRSMAYIKVPDQLGTGLPLISTQQYAVSTYKSTRTYKIKIPVTGHYTFYSNTLFTRFMSEQAVWYGHTEADFNKDDEIFINLWVLATSVDSSENSQTEHELRVTIDNDIAARELTLVEVDSTYKELDKHIVIKTGLTSDATAAKIALDHTLNSNDYRWTDEKKQSQIVGMTMYEVVSKFGTQAFENCLNLVEIVNDTSINIKEELDYIFTNRTEPIYIRTSAQESKIHFVDDSNNEVSNIAASSYIFYEYVVDESVRVRALMSYTANNSIVTLPPETFVIHANAFINNDQITAIYDSESGDTKTKILAIQEKAFYSCDHLQTVELVKQEVDAICTGAFESCPALQFFTLYSLGTMAADSFIDCFTNIGNMGNISAIGGIREILGNPIARCSSCPDFSINPSPAIDEYKNQPFELQEPIKTYEYNYFSGCLIERYVTGLGENDQLIYDPAVKLIGVFPSLTQIEDFNDNYVIAGNLGMQLSEIGAKAFQNVSNLKTAIIGPNVQVIGTEAFKGTGLTSLEFAARDNTLGIDFGNRAFADCALSDITIPAKINHMGYGVFINNAALNSIILTHSDYVDIKDGQRPEFSRGTWDTRYTRWDTRWAVRDYADVPEDKLGTTDYEYYDEYFYAVSYSDGTES